MKHILILTIALLGVTALAVDPDYGFREGVRSQVQSNIYSVAVSFPGNTTVASNLVVTGAETVGSTLGVAGAATLDKNLAVKGNATVGTNLAVTGVATFTGKPVLNGAMLAAGGTNAAVIALPNGHTATNAIWLQLTGPGGTNIVVPAWTMP